MKCDLIRESINVVKVLQYKTRHALRDLGKCLPHNLMLNGHVLTKNPSPEIAK